MFFMQVPLVQMRPDAVMLPPLQPLAPARDFDGRLVETMIDGLRAGQQRREQALAMLRGHVARLAFDSAGCRLVQEAFEVANRATSSELLAELQGRVGEAARSPHANYVIQKVITVGTPAQVAIVARELMGSAVLAAQHRYGCRILCRLSEHCSSVDVESAAVMDEVLAEAEQLYQHPFGHHVIQSIVEHGNSQQQHRIAEVLVRGNLRQMGVDSLSSHVVAAAFRHCSDDDVQALGVRLVACGQRGMVELGKSRFGLNVLRAALQRSGPVSQQILGMLRRAAHPLSGSRYGRVLLREVGIVPAEGAEVASAQEPVIHKAIASTRPTKSASACTRHSRAGDGHLFQKKN
jgi:pumilio RNA-binding family